MEEGKVIIGIDYYTQLVTENVELKAKVEALRRMVEAEKTSVLYAKDVALIFGFEKKGA